MRGRNSTTHNKVWTRAVADRDSEFILSAAARVKPHHEQPRRARFFPERAASKSFDILDGERDRRRFRAISVELAS